MSPLCIYQYGTLQARVNSVTAGRGTTGRGSCRDGGQVSGAAGAGGDLFDGEFQCGRCASGDGLSLQCESAKCGDFAGDVLGGGGDCGVVSCWCQDAP